jgi:large subunit ribosomal protein L1
LLRSLLLPQKSIMQRGKKYRAVVEKMDLKKVYAIQEAITLVHGGKIAKFDESVEVHVKLNIDPKKGDEQVRGTVVLPHGTGKTLKIAVVTSTKAKDAQEAGADFIGGEELIEKIKLGKMETFDVLLATPEMMPKLAGVAKILGPRGLMPSPKTETVTEKIKEAVEMLKKGKASFKNDNSGNVHQVIGKLSFTEGKLTENYEAIIDAITKARPAGIKGRYVVSISICSTMGPGLRISL